MKQTNFLTKLFLLCALIVGSTSVWADEETIISWSRSGSTDTYTEGYTFEKSEKGEAKSGYYQDSGTAGSSVISLSLYHKTNKLFTNTLKSVTFKATLGAGSTKDPLGNNVKACFVDKDGKDIDGSSVDVTSKITNKDGSEFTVSMSTEKAANAYGVKIFHTKEDKWNVRYYGFSLNYEEEEVGTKHTLSSAVNPDGVGSVTLGATEVGEGKSTTIVAEATNPAYQFKNWTKTSGTIADENAASTTFTMGTGEATVTANFEEKPTHAINITSTADGTITVKYGDDEIASGDKIYEGATLTISAEAGENREFTSWSVTGATPASTTENPTTLTVGTDDITIAATFNTITTHKISWSVNDVIVKSENIKEGDAITFAAPESGIPEGYVYKGWVVEDDKINTPTDDDPKAKYVTSGTSTVDITYYCVMAKETGAPATLTKQSKGASFAANDKIVVVAVVNETTSYGMYQETQSNSYVKYFEFKEDVNDISSDSKKWWTLNTSNSKWKIGDGTNGYLYNSGSNNLSVPAGTTSATEWNIVDNEDGTFKIDKGGSGSRYVSCRTDLIEKTNHFRMAGGTPAGVYNFVIYKYVEGSASYSNYCTTVPTTETVTKLAGRTYGTYVTKNALDFTDADVEAYIAKGITGEGDAATLEIEKVTTVKAGTPIIVKSDDKSVTSANVKIITDAEAANNGDNKLVAGDGTDVTTDVAYTYYYIASDKFHKATTGSLVVGKAYLKLETASAKAFTIAIGGDGETTGINTLDSRLSTLDKAQSMYNLAGQKVSNSYKGIVIINGKKVIK